MPVPNAPVSCRFPPEPMVAFARSIPIVVFGNPERPRSQSSRKTAVFRATFAHSFRSISPWMCAQSSPSISALVKIGFGLTSSVSNRAVSKMAFDDALPCWTRLPASVDLLLRSRVLLRMRFGDMSNSRRRTVASDRDQHPVRETGLGPRYAPSVRRFFGDSCFLGDERPKRRLKLFDRQSHRGDPDGWRT